MLAARTDAISAVAFSADGTRLASCSIDGTVITWDPDTQQETGRFEAGHGGARSAAFSPSGNVLCVGAADGSIVVLNPRMGPKVHVVAGDAASVVRMAFNPDGSRLAAASSDGAVAIWETSNWRQLVRLEARVQSIRAIGFLADSRQIVTADQHQGIRIHDASSGIELSTLDGSEEVRGLVVMDAGRRLASAGDDEVIKFWDARPRSEDVRNETQSVALLWPYIGRHIGKDKYLDAVHSDQSVQDSALAGLRLPSLPNFGSDI